MTPTVARSPVTTGRPLLALLSLAALLPATDRAVAAAESFAGSVDRCATLVPPVGVVFDAVPSWIDSDALPRHCRATGTIDGYVRFEMRFPEDWTGRFMMAGCGGFCGELLPDKAGRSNSINQELQRGYAVISHDSGHRARRHKRRGGRRVTACRRAPTGSRRRAGP